MGVVLMNRSAEMLRSASVAASGSSQIGAHRVVGVVRVQHAAHRHVLAALRGLQSAALAAAPVEVALREATTVTVGTAYAVGGSQVTFTPEMFTPLDTQAGHVLTARVMVASEGGTPEPLTLHASAVAPEPCPPTEWHGFGFQLSEAGFVYHGNTATLTVTRLP